MIELAPFLTGALASFVGAGIREAVNWLNARKKLEQAAEAEFHSALASDSLHILGDYLDKAVGQFSVAEYSHNPQVRQRVNMFLARVEDFVGKTEDVRQSEAQLTVPVYSSVLAVATDEELESIEERVLGGAVWDGLAHLRRVIEQRLRELAKERELRVPERHGAARLVDLLRRNGVGDSAAWEGLPYVLNVCNRAVHGLEVSTTEALEAVRIARETLSALGLMHRRLSQG